MLILIFVTCLAILILFNPRTEEDEVSPACNMAAWMLAIAAFAILLSVASVVGAGLAALAVVP